MIDDARSVAPKPSLIDPKTKEEDCDDGEYYDEENIEINRIKGILKNMLRRTESGSMIKI